MRWLALLLLLTSSQGASWTPPPWQLREKASGVQQQRLFRAQQRAQWKL